MQRLLTFGRWVGCLCLLSLALAAGGCEGTDTREKVDDTVQEMTGQKNVERYHRIKDDLGEIQKKQADRYRQLDPDTAADNE